VLRQPTVRITVAIAAAAAVALLAAGPAAHWPGLTSQPAALNRAGALPLPGPGSRRGAQAGPLADAGRQRGRGESGGAASAKPDRSASRSPTRSASPRRPRRRRDGATASYRNPLRAISGLIGERIDQGVDFGGVGPIYALGDGVITNAVAGTAGWPGGGWITYRLTNGPAVGLTVFVAEDVTPTVTVGQTVTSATVIASMFNGGAGIETGWAAPDAWYTESQSAAAGGISGGGPFPTRIGLNYEELLQALGVPAANNRDQHSYGLLPTGYPVAWRQP